MAFSVHEKALVLGVFKGVPTHFHRFIFALKESENEEKLFESDYMKCRLF